MFGRDRVNPLVADRDGVGRQRCCELPRMAGACAFGLSLDHARRELAESRDLDGYLLALIERVDTAMGEPRASEGGYARGGDGDEREGRGPSREHGSPSDTAAPTRRAPAR